MVSPAGQVLPVSIAMATYNGERHLPMQLASLRSQTLLPSEVVICDDDSTDGTLTLLEAFRDCAPFPVTVHRNATRLGYKQNFMRAASLCTAPVIAFCDQDDVWLDHKLAIVANHFESTDSMVLSHDFTVEFDDGRPPIPSFFEHLEASGLHTLTNIKGCSLAYRREMIDRLGWPAADTGFSHDFWICLAGCLLDRRAYLSEPLIRHQVHGANASAWLPGGAAPWRRLLRTLQLPPFTSGAELDLFIARFVSDKQAAPILAAIERCRGELPADRYCLAVQALGRRERLCAFVKGNSYLRAIDRLPRALALFLSRAYRNGDGLLGLAEDVYGSNIRRHSI